MQNTTTPTTQQVTTNLDRKRSPPPSPPSPDVNGNDNESNLRRKREREASLEPATSSKTDTARTPAKKNRVQLGKTSEEDENNHKRVGGSRSRTPSPLLSASPRQELKVIVRQISQGVEDLTWQQKDAAIEDKESSSEEDKSLKRRATSAAPQDAQTETTKRLRDDPDVDANPRETKRPSPPPDKAAEKEAEAEKATATPSGSVAYAPTNPSLKSESTLNALQSDRPSTPPIAAPKMTGFMAYASSSSPFASAKGSNIFSNHTPSRAIAPFTSPQEPNLTTPSKRSGFEAFASSESPFAKTSRSKSPVLGSSSKLGRNKSPTRRAAPASANAFSSYASTGITAFSPQSHKRVKTLESTEASPSPLANSTSDSVPLRKGSSSEDDEEGNENYQQGSFGAKLRAGKDEEEEEEVKVNLTEQDVITGEEDEETIHQVRGKLYALDSGQWKERGTGLLKLNVRRKDGERPRLVMRKEAVYTVLLNVVLFKGMKCGLSQDPRYIRLSVIENGVAQHYNVRVASAKSAEDMLEEINANIPGGTVEV